MISVLFILISVSCLVLASATTVAPQASAPGKAAFWSLGQMHATTNPATTTSTQYITRPMSYDLTAESIKHTSDSSEVTILLRSKGGNEILLHDEGVAAFSKAVPATEVMPYIYRTETTGGLHQHISSSDFMKDSKKMSLEELHSQLMKSIDHKEGALFNHSPDVYEASLSGDAAVDTSRLTDLSIASAKIGKRVSIVAYQEPGASAFSPKIDAQYSRVLTTSQTLQSSSSDLQDGIYYKPSGAEFSIYYADTYLYITPDIFTGIMTGLFITFVIYTGLTRMGMIQGGSSFPMKKIDNGREY